jgi:hypothetical protein
MAFRYTIPISPKLVRSHFDRRAVCELGGPPPGVVAMWEEDLTADMADFIRTAPRTWEDPPALHVLRHRLCRRRRGGTVIEFRPAPPVDLKTVGMTWITSGTQVRVRRNGTVMGLVGHRTERRTESGD